ncbi:hypothetical protein IDSA_09710 [Pseudidiomarina salinarum]|uniref:Uncharacterized protein n=1 Tax=Pseudidiomarina salinarum TaxID=435908 RepID=A0A094IX16_9GAMM|nr:hypothetical protein [Pseudidiomarina salinarum]KFZ30334.1 hypothetical protein IDSA_09710 [Pseudidiomarina salinarum]RUO68487.1 hypothetical protein CWI79_10410 [Pseudidiomarina salinarum]
MRSKSSSNFWWIVAAIALLFIFGDEILGLIAGVFAMLLAIGITGIVVIAVVAGAFALVLMIGGSVALAMMAAVFALAVVLFSWLWPFLLLAAIIYLMVRKRPKAV